MIINSTLTRFVREGNGCDSFPRVSMALMNNKNPDVNAFRMPVGSLSDMVSFALRFDNDVYTSIFSEAQKEQSVYDTIVLDIDAGHQGVEAAYDNYKEIKEIFQGNEIRGFCSGRGFHVYLDYAPLQFKNYGETMREFARQMGISRLIDMSVLVDKAKVIRIPGTKNSKTGTYCVAIDPSDNYEQIKYRSERNVSAIHRDWMPVNEDMRKMLKDIDISTKQYDVIGEIPRTGFLSENGEPKNFPPCIQEMMSDFVRTGQMGHDRRLVLGNYLVKVWGVDRSNAFFATNAEVYDKYKTLGQLNHFARQTHFNMYGCRRIGEHGDCRFADKRRCVFYPNMTRLI